MKPTTILFVVGAAIIMMLLLPLLWKKVEALFERGFQLLKNRIIQNKNSWTKQREKFRAWQTKHLPEFSFVSFFITSGIGAVLGIAAVADYKLLTATFQVMFGGNGEGELAIAKLSAIVFVLIQIVIGFFTTECLGISNVLPFASKMSNNQRKQSVIACLACLLILCMCNSYLFVWRVEHSEAEGASALVLGVWGFVLPVIMACLGYVFPICLGQFGILFSHFCTLILVLLEQFVTFFISLFLILLALLKLVLRIVSWIGELILGLFKSKAPENPDDEKNRNPDLGPKNIFPFKPKNGKKIDEEVEHFFRDN